MQLILDTNIYRNLVKGLSDLEVLKLGNHIKIKCKEKNITIPFPIVSAMELISRLNDLIDNERIECLKALKLLVSINVRINKNNGRIGGLFIPPMDAVLGDFLFGDETDFINLYSPVIDLALKITGYSETKVDDDIKKDIDIVKQQLFFEKEQIKNNYEHYITSLSVDGKLDWRVLQKNKKLRKDFFLRLHRGDFDFLIAQSFLIRSFSNRGLVFEKNDNNLRILSGFMTKFLPVFKMNNKLLKEVGNGTIAMSDSRDPRWNTIPDISLIFGALYKCTEFNKIFVTEEKDIVRSFNEGGFPDNVIKLQAFKDIFFINL